MKLKLLPSPCIHYHFGWKRLIGARYCANTSRWRTVSKFNTLRLRQNGRYFADDTFKCIFLNENVWISIKKINWNLFQRVHLTIFKHWFIYWLGTNQATSHYMNQCLLDYWRICAALGLNELMDIHYVSHPEGVFKSSDDNILRLILLTSLVQDQSW